MAAATTREIRFAWWHPQRTCRLFFGHGIHFHDLWVEEVQALVDQLTFVSEATDYRPPQPFVGRFENDLTWLVDYHRSRPGKTLCAFMDCVGEDGDDVVWDICWGGACVTISEAEADELVRKWQEFIREEKTDWTKEGF